MSTKQIFTTETEARKNNPGVGFSLTWEKVNGVKVWYWAEDNHNQEKYMCCNGEQYDFGGSDF